MATDAAPLLATLIADATVDELNACVAVLSPESLVMLHAAVSARSNHAHTAAIAPQASLPYELALMVVEAGASSLIDEGNLRQALRLCQVSRESRRRLEPRLMRMKKGWSAQLSATQNVSGNLGQIYTQHQIGFAVGPPLPSAGRASWAIQHADEIDEDENRNLAHFSRGLGIGLCDMHGSVAFAFHVNNGPRWQAYSRAHSNQWRRPCDATCRNCHMPFCSLCATPEHASLGVPAQGMILLHNDGPPSNGGSSYQRERPQTVTSCFLDRDVGILYMRVNNGPVMRVLGDIPTGTMLRPFVALLCRRRDGITLTIPGPRWPRGKRHSGDL